MVLEISSDVLRHILDEAKASPAREVCGLLFGTADRIADALACRNVADDPATAFEIDPARLIAFLRAARAGGAAIVGCYHSHPAGPPLPSARDAAAAAADGAIWLIAAQATIGCYRAVAAGHHHGRFDEVAYRATR